MTLAICGFLALGIWALAAAGWSESERDDADPPLADPEDPAITTDDLMALPAEHPDPPYSEDLDGERKSA